MRGLDPLLQSEKVLPRVYNAQTGKRLVRRLRLGRSYGGVTTIDVVGCNMLCSYCYVDTSFLTGRGELLEREIRKGTAKPYSPQELAAEYSRAVQEKKWPVRVQVTAAEPFLTPDWLIALLVELQPIMERQHERVWVDTNGVTLAAHPELMDRLLPFKDFLRIFVSSKNAPPLYTAMTRADQRYADTAFRCLEGLWSRKLVAFLQAPIADLFLSESFPWYLERLIKIHPAAPLLLDIDRLCYMPLSRIRSRLKSVSLWTRRVSGVKAEQGWQRFLEAHYSRKFERLLFSVDSFPEDEGLVRRFIFEGEPIEHFPLFLKSQA